MPRPFHHHAYLQTISTPLAITSPPAEDLGLIVVIPCFNERSICETLTSLHQAYRPTQEVEVIVVINASARDDEVIHIQNRRSLSEIDTWKQHHTFWQNRLHVLYEPDMPLKHAGVGLARKWGMDEAVARFAHIQRPEGLIITLDADCQVAKNYFQAIESYFLRTPHCAHAHVYFEHPLTQLPKSHQLAMASYELYLRSFVHALRYSKLRTYAFHTVGSTMIASAKSYVEVWGMNRKQAGEDFYFMQKLMQKGPLHVITDTCVYPSARISMRVPFGTGKAVSKIMHDGVQQVGPNPKHFKVLRDFLTPIYEAQTPPQWTELVHEHSASTLQDFMHLHQGQVRYQEICEHTASMKSFRRRFFQWFTGFMAIKFLNFARHQQQDDVLINELAWYIVQQKNKELSTRVTHSSHVKGSQQQTQQEEPLQADDTMGLLMYFRMQDQEATQNDKKS